MRRFAFLASCSFFFVLSLVFGGCGRSGLDEALVGIEPLDASIANEAGPDGGPSACGPATCPSGCCDASGACRVGTDRQSCGSAGGACADCIGTGFDFCDSGTRSCGKSVLACNAETCSSGCCTAGTDGQLVCVAGTARGACGKSGEACRNCGDVGQACDATQRVCVATACSAATCPTGCCAGDTCVTAQQNNACGSRGEACVNCAQTGRTCASTAGGFACVGQPACDANNCRGCCVGATCVGGGDNTACGSAGTACLNCEAIGQRCALTGGRNQCVPQPLCGPGNCNGCCVGNTCVAGNSPLACGAGGAACRACGGNETCSAGTCQTRPTCGPGNCSGCCVGNVCVVGSANNQCGRGGAQCDDCQGRGLVCQNATCQSPACGPGTCAGCCAGNTCVIGIQDSSCGRGGVQCINCAQQGGVCSPGGVCQAPCSQNNCAGCCRAGQCEPGFLDTSCGSSGAACANCRSTGSTCNTSSVPRICRNQQQTCPAAYPTCPNGVSTPAPLDQNVCSRIEMQNARAACAGGATSPGCDAFFQFIQSTNPQCFSCLSPFKKSIQSLDGIFACVAPFVSPQCNRATGCATDCVNTSCSQCSAAAVGQCQADSRTGQCGNFFQQVAQCVGTALIGTASFCNPGAYPGGNYGAWLEGVGNRFCGP